MSVSQTFQNKKNLRPAVKPIAVFIVGTTRSGTTLMHRLLCSHSCLVGAGETFILKRYDPSVTSISEFAKSIAAGDQENKIVQEHFNKFFRNNSLRDIGPFKFLDEYCRAFCLHFSRTGYVEKTNVHSFFVQGILDNISNSKIIVTIRDPRATLASKLKANKVCRGKRLNLPAQVQFGLNLSKIIFTYNYLDNFFSEKFRDRVLFVKYEDLVENNEKSLERIFDFLNLPCEPVHQNINPFDLSIARRGLSFLHNSSYSNEKSKNISTASVNRWADLFSEKEVCFIEKCFSSLNLGFFAEFYPEFKPAKKDAATLLMSVFSKIDCLGYLLKNIKTPSLLLTRKLQQEP